MTRAAPRISRDADWVSLEIDGVLVWHQRDPIDRIALAAPPPYTGSGAEAKTLPLAVCAACLMARVR